MYLFDGWRVHSILEIPDNLPQTQDMPVRIAAQAPTEGAAPTVLGKHLRTRHVTSWQLQPRTKWNVDQTHDAQRCVPLNIFVRWSIGMGLSSTRSTHRHGCILSKGVVEHGKWYQPTGEALPVISKEVTSELLHCLTALPDPWPLAKITIDLEKPGQ